MDSSPPEMFFLATRHHGPGEHEGKVGCQGAGQLPGRRRPRSEIVRAPGNAGTDPAIVRLGTGQIRQVDVPPKSTYLTSWLDRSSLGRYLFGTRSGSIGMAFGAVVMGFAQSGCSDATAYPPA